MIGRASSATTVQTMPMPHTPPSYWPVPRPPHSSRIVAADSGTATWRVVGSAGSGIPQMVSTGDRRPTYFLVSSGWKIERIKPGSTSDQFVGLIGLPSASRNCT